MQGLQSTGGGASPAFQPFQKFMLARRVCGGICGAMPYSVVFSAVATAAMLAGIPSRFSASICVQTGRLARRSKRASQRRQTTPCGGLNCYAETTRAAVFM